MFQKELGKVDYRILSKGIAAYRKVQAGFLEPYPNVRKTLIRLREKGTRLGIVSDAPKLKAWLRLAEMNLTDFFDVVVALEDTGQLKPSKMPFQAAINELKLTPEEILFVGDNPGRDIRGAASLGMKTALAKYGQVFPSEGIRPDYTLSDIQEILKIV